MIEKIINALEEESQYSCSHCMARAISIVQEVAKEYDNVWIPCEVALPKEATTYEVTCEIILCSEKQYITTYALWGTEGEWICRKNERVIAWKEKSAPYQKGE